MKIVLKKFGFMHSVTILLSAFLLAAGSFPGQAHAFGLGGYASIGGGTAEYEAESAGGTTEVDLDSVIKEFGFVMDTNLAMDRLFNYRVNLGYQMVEHENGASPIELEGFVLNQDFGFAVMRNRNLRLWLGPELQLSYLSGEIDINPNWDITLYGVGLGPVVGMNFNIGRSLTLGLKGGYLFTYRQGDGEDNSGGGSSFDYEVQEHLFFVNLAVLFRINDSFSRGRTASPARSPSFSSSPSSSMDTTPSRSNDTGEVEFKEIIP